MRRLFLLAAITAGAIAAHPGAAAACPAGARMSAHIADGRSDGDLRLAPELTAVDVRVDGRCRLSVQPTFGDRNAGAGLFLREGVAIYLDTDGSALTGSPAWSGADVAVVTAGRLGASAGPALGRWTGTRFSFRHARRLAGVGIGGFRAPLGAVGVTAPITLGVRVGTSWTGVLGTYRDFAPDRGAPPRSLALGSGGAPAMILPGLVV